MEKVSVLSGGLNFNTLFPTFAKKRATILNRFLPGWTNDRIDSKLFIPKNRDARPIRLRPSSFASASNRATAAKCSRCQ